MAQEVVLLDTNILIDFFRKTQKENSMFYELSGQFDSVAVSAITEYEIFIGSTVKQDEFWMTLFKQIKVHSFDSHLVRECIKIHRELRKERIIMDVPDLMIAATARFHNMKLATLNHKHFSHVAGLEII